PGQGMPPLALIPRPDWLACYFDCGPGQHAAWFYPTQMGKTHSVYQCAEITLARHPGLRLVSLMPKARSPATRRHAARLGLQIIGGWPPPARFPWQKRPAGYVLWPPHLRNADVQANREHLARVFRKCLHDQLWRGESVTIADDAHRLVLLGLNPELEEHLTTGAEGGAGLWLANQKTSGTRAGALTTFAYNQPKDFMLGYEPLKENRRRFGDIPGVDPGFLADYVSRLPRHPVRTPEGIKNISDFVHLDQRGPYLCHVTGL
ncbi:MAG: hypothetical protein ACRDPY_48230, partial [Streptosporangiaceae bacterium]